MVFLLFDFDEGRFVAPQSGVQQTHAECQRIPEGTLSDKHNLGTGRKTHFQQALRRFTLAYAKDDGLTVSFELRGIHAAKLTRIIGPQNT